MTFKRLAEYFSQLEQTTLRNSMVEILSSLFKEAHLSEVGKLSYLLQGRVAPLFEAIEFGMADKLVIRAVANGLGTDAKKVKKEFNKEGDLGKAVEKLKLDNSKQITVNRKKNILDVYDILYQVATSAGEGSQDGKIKLLGSLLAEVDPLSARYIIRIPLNKMRLGFSDMTMLDSLSWMVTGSKKLRPQIESAYNVRPDLGFISQTLKEKGIEGLAHVIPKVGTPILMARAERMTCGKDIVEKIGRCAIEPKYDGFRVQVHYKKIINSRLSGIHDAAFTHSSQVPSGQSSKLKSENKEFIKLFSRNLEDVTAMYPDITKGIKQQIKANEAIVEGEAIGINLTTGEYLPFQETVQRKRKYDIEVKAKEIPLTLFAFDFLYLDGKSLLADPYTQRREKLVKLFSKGETIHIADEEVTGDAKRIEEIFMNATTKGLEGIMAKKPDGIYRAGSRDFNWIKYKRSYASKLSDTVDAVVMGYDLGQGKRSGFGIGDFLIGIFDEKKELFVTIAKIGTGLTDEEWKYLQRECQKIKIKDKSSLYDVDKMMSCDVWVGPQIVVEIRADEITRSPVHTAGRIMVPSKSGSAFEVKVAGLALRFPRLERFRDDKKPQDATTLKELEKMFQLQGRKH